MQYIYSKVEICHLSLIFFLSVDERLENLTVNKKTPEGINTGCVGVNDNKQRNGEVVYRPVNMSCVCAH